MKNTVITIASGDGIGKEIMSAVIDILKSAQVPLDFEYIEIGEKSYKEGHTSGITNKAWEIIKKNKIILKSPITTPLGEGYKSLNVTLRRGLELFANVRPAKSYLPGGKKIDMVIIRENEEDLYSGIEYEVTENTSLAIKVVTKENCRRIIRYSFDFAESNSRKKVTAISKSNIMKITDGAFQKIFFEIAKEYPNIQAEHMLVDIAAAKIATRPENFDVVVTLNLYGDILSDISSEVSGSVGLVGSANLGKEYSMFEAVHGSAPDIAGKDIANPSGLLHAAVLMLKSLNMYKHATLIANAWMKTIKDGCHTADIYSEKSSKVCVGTKKFTQTVIDNILLETTDQQTKYYEEVKILPKVNSSLVSGDLVGVDIFILGLFSDALAIQLSDVSNKLKLSMVSCKGLMIWPTSISKCTSDVYRYRFLSVSSQNITQGDVLELIGSVHNLGLHIGMTVSLQKFGSRLGYSLAQGE